MSVEEGLKNRLIENHAVFALVATRIYDGLVPQGGAYPAISFQGITGTRVQGLDGPSGVSNAVVQVNCWAKTYTAVKDLAKKVRQALDGFSGTLGTIPIKRIMLLNDTDITDNSRTIDENRIRGVRMDFGVMHDE